MIRKLQVTSKTKEQTTSKRMIIGKLKAAIEGNKNYLAITAPTAAQRNEQVADLTRQMNRLIRLTLQDFRDS